jgi:hypothetical protein
MRKIIRNSIIERDEEKIMNAADETLKIED